MKPDVDVHWIQIGFSLLSEQMPIHVIERPPMHEQAKAWSGGTEVAREGTYHVPQLDAFQVDPRWARTATGRYVRIPVSAYRTSSRSLASIWGLGLQVGMAFLDAFRSHNVEEIKQLTLVLGDDCTDLAPQGFDAFRCYVGVAIKT